MVLLVSTSAAAAHADPLVGEPAPTAVVSDGWARASEQLRVRSAAGVDGVAADRDGRVLLDVGGAAWDGRLVFDGAAAVYVDLDGRDPALSSIHDVGGPVEPVLYGLTVGAAGGPWLRRAVVGRLAIEEGSPMILDGVAVGVAPLVFLPRDGALGLGRSQLFASVGRTVHFYSFDDDTPEDWALSVGVDD
jgi:hypothetical protein